MTLRRWITCAAIAAMLAACQAASERDPAANLRAEQVGPVTVSVPAGWSREDGVTADLVASAEFVPRSSTSEHIQVIIGCGGADADDLVIATVQQPRNGMTVTDAEDAPAVEVSGMDSARRTVLTFGAGRMDDANTIRTYGLYAGNEFGLVLIEYSSTAARFQRGLGRAIVESVAVDSEQLEQACRP